jgi:hypothetical protein
LIYDNNSTVGKRISDIVLPGLLVLEIFAIQRRAKIVIVISVFSPFNRIMSVLVLLRLRSEGIDDYCLHKGIVGIHIFALQPVLQPFLFIATGTGTGGLMSLCSIMYVPILIS